MAPLPVIRPVTVHPVKPEPDIRPTSNGWLRWEFSIEQSRRERNSPGQKQPPGSTDPRVTAFLNADRGPLPTWRFALGGTARS